MTQKTLASLMILILLISTSWSQEDEAAEESVEVPASDELTGDTAVTATDDDVELIVDDDLDDQLYEEDEDEFVPTEEIPADEPIPFPSNI